MFDYQTITIILVTFLIAGTVKGTIGLGLPTTSLVLLTLSINLPSAMALLLVPSLITNIWQAFTGSHGLEIIKRFWLFFLVSTLCAWPGAIILSVISIKYSSGLLGLLLMLYASFSLGKKRYSINSNTEKYFGVGSGIINGVVTGMTGSFIFPGVLFLNSVGLQKEKLFQAMGILFTLSTLSLAFALNQVDLLNLKQTTWSSIATIPAIVGMLLGNQLRKKISEKLFQTIFLITIFVIGSYLFSQLILV